MLPCAVDSGRVAHLFKCRCKCASNKCGSPLAAHLLWRQQPIRESAVDSLMRCHAHHLLSHCPCQFHAALSQQKRARSMCLCPAPGVRFCSRCMLVRHAPAQPTHNTRPFASSWEVSTKARQTEQWSPLLSMHAALHAPGLFVQGSQPRSLPLRAVLPLTGGPCFLHALRRTGHRRQPRHQHGLAYSRRRQSGGQRLSLRLLQAPLCRASGAARLSHCNDGITGTGGARECRQFHRVSHLLIKLAMLGLCGKCASQYDIAHGGLGDVFCSAHWQAPPQPCIQLRAMF